MDDDDFFSVDGSVVVVALTRLGTPPVAVFEKAIRDKQHNYFESFSVLGAHGKTAIPALVDALKDDDGDVRIHAFNAICHFGATAEPAVPAPSRSKGKDTIDHFEAAAPAPLGEAARPVVPVLMKMFPKLDKDAALAVTRTLAEIDPAGTECLSALSTLLRSPDSPLRKEICATLGYMGPAASALVPCLIGIAKTGHDESQVAAITALGRIGPARPPRSQPLSNWRQTMTRSHFSRLSHLVELGQRLCCGSQIDSISEQRRFRISADRPPALWARLVNPRRRPFRL